ncbi:MAG: InlB B-repeat-containing protein, partial [Paludibacteraceae bacterium]|nr:InlB B-repeat-containing protein [Paludibacteraceae bacterium]
MDRQEGTGGTVEVTVTNGQPMPGITVPTRAGYDFKGYFTEEGGAGTQYYDDDGKGVTNWDIEDAEFTLYAKWTEKPLTNYRTFCDVVCDAYSFHTGTGEKETWAKEAIKCFAQLGSTTEWQIKDYIIPTDEKFFVDKYGYFYNDNLGTNNSRSLVKTWAEEMYIAPAMDSGDGEGSPKLGQATGAKGTLRIFDDSEWNNLYVGFIPDGYKLKFGNEEYTFAMHDVNNHEWRSEEVVEYNSTTAAYNVSVGVVDAAGKYVATDHTQEMRHIFLKDDCGWNADGAKLAIYYWKSGSPDGWCGFLKLVPGETNLYEGWIPKDYTNLKFVRFNSTKGSVGDWEDKWNETGDLTVSSNQNLFTMTAFSSGTWSTYERYGQFAMHDNSKSKNWYVHFVPHYELTYDKNANDATGEMDVQTVVVDAADKKVVVQGCGFTRPGYRFVKWQKDNTSTYYVPNGSNTIDLNTDITLKAVWEKEYTVTWNPAGGNWSGDANNIVQIYVSGEQIEAPEKPQLTGHEFVEWTPAYTTGMTMQDKDVVFIAIWQPNTYTVTLNPNYPAGKTGTFTDKDGNTVSGNLVLTYNYNTASQILTDLYKTLELDGYQFNGWFNATSGGAKWTETGTITKNITLYAQWTQRHTVTWMVNGEELDLDATYTSCLHDVKVNKLPPAPDSRCGKVFVGWTTETIDSERDTPPSVLFKISDASPNVTADITYHAVWADETLGGAGEQVTDVLNRDWTGVSGTSSSTWSGKESTSGAVYRGTTAGGNESIQLRSTTSNNDTQHSGIITTTSDGKSIKVEVTWHSNTHLGRTLDVYGKSSKYGNPNDLFGVEQGTKIGSIVCGTSTELTISGDYEFIGLRSNSGAMYLEEITL